MTHSIRKGDPQGMKRNTIVGSGFFLLNERNMDFLLMHLSNSTKNHIWKAIGNYRKLRNRQKRLWGVLTECAGLNFLSTGLLPKSLGAELHL